MRSKLLPAARQIPMDIDQNRRRFLGFSTMAIVAAHLGLTGCANAQSNKPAVRLVPEGSMPSLAGATGWLNSPPLTPANLRGKVVLINFWTFSCINSLRQLPYLRAWATKYKDQGLVVVGVQAPEFEFEKSLAPDKPAVFREIARVLKTGGRLAVSDIALKGELPEAVARSMAAYVGCIAGAIRIGDYRDGLLAAGFEHVEIVDSGADLNAYAKVENQSGCCSPAMDGESCCAPAPDVAASQHTELTELLTRHDINAAAASIKVYPIKPKVAASVPCCGPSCCA
jgi:thiol-disulfide isomerase/thioredoxin